MKVKLFVETDENELEKKINEFIAGKKIIDIKLSTSSVQDVQEEETASLDVFTVLVMYE